MEYYPPKYLESGFTCPHCGTYSQQSWKNRLFGCNEGFNDAIEFFGYSTTRCFKCDEISIWFNDEMVFPKLSQLPLPAKEMPEDIKKDYNEARNVFVDSPRASAALLRLAIQKICKLLGGKGDNINDDIAKLVSLGLPEKIQKSLDIVRVIGNNSVHPGVIDVNDNPEIAAALFKLINLIVDYLIITPKEVNDFYDALPKAKREAIERRDNK